MQRWGRGWGGTGVLGVQKRRIEEFNLGPESRQDHSELKVLLKYKGDRESF